RAPIRRRRQFWRSLPAVERRDAGVVGDRGGRDPGAADRFMGRRVSRRAARQPRLLIWGAGAIGGTLGAYLSRAGNDVTMVDMCVEHVDAIVRDGLQITGPIDDFVVRVPAFTPQSISGTWPDIILATKAHHTDVAVRALRPHLAPDGCVVSA